jgi:hypothetical protein
VFIPDLVVASPDQPPSPYPFPLPIRRHEKWGIGTLPPGLALLPVGWLGNSVPTTGSAPPEVIEALLREYQTGAIFSDGSAGWHDCELCPGPEAWYPDGQVGPIVSWDGRGYRLYGHGHYLLRHGTKVFMAPALLVHYIVNHGYRPPDEFLNAAIHGSFLRPDDLHWTESDVSPAPPSA